MIEVSINGEKRSLADGLRLTDLLADLGVPEEVVIVELNGQVVPRNRYGDRPVRSGDTLELIRLIGGG